MKKTAMLLIALAGLAGCAQDDDLYTAALRGETMTENTFYAKGEEPRDSVVIPPVAENPDGDPPPKDKEYGNGHKPNSGDSIKINLD